MHKVNLNENINDEVYAQFLCYVIRGTQDECWFWNGPRAGEYGSIMVNRVRYLAHRVALLYHLKLKKSDLLVLHHCDFKLCVNPSHLFLGTQADNMDDCISKGRWRDVKGIQHYAAKLTEQDVLDIRAKRLMGYTYREIGEEYKMHHKSIIDICNYKNWKHVP